MLTATINYQDGSGERILGSLEHDDHDAFMWELARMIEGLALPRMFHGHVWVELEVK